MAGDESKLGTAAIDQTLGVTMLEAAKGGK
jgi:hypothetical protein